MDYSPYLRILSTALVSATAERNPDGSIILACTTSLSGGHRGFGEDTTRARMGVSNQNEVSRVEEGLNVGRRVKERDTVGNWPVPSAGRKGCTLGVRNQGLRAALI